MKTDLIKFFFFRWRLRYIKSDFKGQLPKLYDEGPSGTSLIPSDMNNMNKEEPSRYVRGKERGGKWQKIIMNSFSV